MSLFLYGTTSQNFDTMMTRRMLNVLVVLVGVVHAGPLHYGRMPYVIATIPNHNRTESSKPTKTKRNIQPKCVNGVCEYNPKARDPTDVRGGAYFDPLGIESEAEYHNEEDSDDDDEPPSLQKAPDIQFELKDNSISDDPKCINCVCEYDPNAKETTDIRGGGGNFEGDDDFEEYYDEYDEQEEERPPPRRRPPSRDRRRPPPDNYRRRPPPRYRSSSKGGALDTAASLAKKTVGATTSAAATSLKTSGKAAFYLVSPKHVRRNEIWGVWRLDQQVGKLPDGPFVSCAANVELTPRGDCITKYEDEVYRTPYLFKEKSWPKSCLLEFEARAFQGPNDKRPVLMLYKGYFRRKITDRHVIKIVGKIYELRKQRFGRGARRVQVGTFVARTRLTAPPGGVRLHERHSGNGDDYDAGEYDEDLEYDDEDYDGEEDEEDEDFEE